MKKLKVAGVVTLYNPTDEDISNINTYIDDIDLLFVYDNTEGKNNQSRLPVNKKIVYIYKNENIIYHNLVSNNHIRPNMKYFRKENAYECFL